MLVDQKIFAKIINFEKTYEALRFVAICPVAMEIAQTREHFRTAPVSEANLQWQPIQPGDTWGDNWGSAWFRGMVTIPASFEGAAYLRATTGGPETSLIVDGRHQGSFDANHPVRLLDLNPQEGKTYHVYLEAYAGHTFPGTMPFDAPVAVRGGETQDSGKLIGKNCRQFHEVELVCERENVSAFIFDLHTLRQLEQRLDENSLRRARVQKALEKIFALVVAQPAETTEDVWRAQLSRARDVMQPLLALKNGPTSPCFGIIGHSHIDTAWLWTIAEAKRKLVRTFSSVLSLMDQYPEFRFTMSAAYHADVVRELYPDLFARIQERVKEGRWEINGAMWIEPDCNIPSGEAFVRQCLVGQRATREMFGITSDTLWQPDVFGYSGALPQILQKSEVKYFCTTKIQYNDTNKFPYDTFVWQGIDGTSVLAHFNSIGGTTDPQQLMYAWKDIKHKDVQDRFLVSFGHGDGGGGPTAEMIELGRRVQDLEGCPRTQYTSISEFMEDISAELTDLPLWSGELYLELHRGTLTSMGQIKRYNRRCEFALRTAEFTATLAHLLKNQEYSSGELLAAWKTLLLNQFHDILPGSSIAEVNDEAIAAFAQCLSDVTALTERNLKALAGGSVAGTKLLIANDLSWTRDGGILLTGIPDGMQPSNARLVQKIEDVEGQQGVLVEGLALPSLGYRVVPLTPWTLASASPFRKDGDCVETPFARVRFSAAGQIVSFYDKIARRELVSSEGAFNVLLLGEDVPSESDNWDIDRDQRLKLIPQGNLVRREVVADGPLQLRIRQEYRIGLASTIVQDVIFHATTARVDFETLVDWHEKHQLLKAAFSLDVLAVEARHEIQFGHLTRSTHDNTSWDRAQFDVCAHKWTDISETGYGVTFINDCKYACTVKHGVYQLSLLKSGRHPDARGDEGRHRFTYALLPHQGGFSVESVVRPAYEFNVPVSAIRADASCSQHFSLVNVDAPNIIIEAVKWAENGVGFILRLYEAGKTGTHATIKFGVTISSVSEENLLEEKPQMFETSDNSISVYLRPFEIKTLRCIPADGNPR